MPLLGKGLGQAAAYTIGLNIGTLLLLVVYLTLIEMANEFRVAELDNAFT